MKKIFVGFAFSHHKNTQGGYHHISKYLKYDKIINGQWEKEFYESTSKNIFFRLFRKVYITFLGQGLPITVLRVILISIFRKNHVFHFIYPENSYKWVHYFKRKQNKIVCTFHQPVEYFEKSSYWMRNLKFIDKVILVSESEVYRFEKLTGKNNVVYIPHGVNTNFFRYDSSVTKNNSVLMVGNWLRDFETASKVFKKLNEIDSFVEINVVVSKVNRKSFKEAKVNFIDFVNDSKLLEFYQKARIVYFPFLKFTGNNALLEAASCGSNIIISCSSISNDLYFANEMVQYLDNDIDNIVSSILDKINNDDFEKSITLSDFAKLNYDWGIVSSITEKILDDF